MNEVHTLNRFRRHGNEDFEEIELPIHIIRGRRNMTSAQAWDYAIGMIKVDGLEPTKEFKEYIEKEKKGEVTMADAKKFLDKKYKMRETVSSLLH